MVSATVALTASVLMHVLWNLIARHQPAAAWPLWWALLAHIVLLAPWGVYALWQADVWSASFLGLMAISASANACYFFGLWKAYQYAPVAMVYPLVRSSPVLIALWWLVLTGDSPSLTGWLGILISVAGLALLAGGKPGNGERAAIPWAVMAMIGTSIYSISDKLATGHLPGFASIIGFISVGYGAAFLVLTLALRHQTGRWTPPPTGTVADHHHWRTLRRSCLRAGYTCDALSALGGGCCLLQYRDRACNPGVHLHLW